MEQCIDAHNKYEPPKLFPELSTPVVNLDSFSSRLKRDLVERQMKREISTLIHTRPSTCLSAKRKTHLSSKKLQSYTKTPVSQRLYIGRRNMYIDEPIQIPPEFMSEH